MLKLGYFAKSNLVFMLLLLLTTRISAAAPQAVPINRIAADHSANQYFNYLEDENASLTIDDLLQGSYQDMFASGAAEVLNKGFSQSAFWLHSRFSFPEQPDIYHITRYVSLEYSLLDSVDFYVIENGEVTGKWLTGDSRPFNTRPVDYSRFLFPVEFNRGDIKDIYIRVQSTSLLRMPVTIWTPSEFHDAQRPKLLLDGLYFGILLLMLCYNLFLYATARDASYLYYIAYILSIAAFQLAMSGYGFEYLWPNTPQVNEFLIPLSICAISIFVLAFGQRILDLRKQSPLLYFIVNIIIVLEIAGAITSLLLPYAVVIQTLIVFTVIVAAVKLYISIQQSLRRIHTAQLFLFAWFTFLCGAMALAATSMGWLPVNFLTTNSFIIGSAVEVIVLSFILAERSHQINKAKAFAEKQAKDALQLMNDSLRETNRTKDEFLATISHELRTPMNGVLGCLQHASQCPDQSSLDTYLNHADRSARHMMLLIDSLLTYTELQSGNLQLQQEPFRIGEMLDKARLLFADTCAKKEIRLRMSLDSVTPHTLFGDSYRVGQIFNNLIDNAIKFTHRGEILIEITCAAIDHESQSLKLIFSISDTGIGIEPEKQSQIFESFRQADATNNRGYGGLGIGLSVVKALLDKMDGTIECRSNPGQGSRFEVTFPCLFQNQDLTSRIDEQAHQPSRHAAPLQVLVVEDNPVNQLVIKSLLTRHGYTIVTASNGAQALLELEQYAIDVVLMDCQMPIMDGFETTEKIRNMDHRHAHLPIIAVTANGMSDDRHRCIQAGMNDYLCKPIDAQVLHRKIVYWTNNAARQKTG
ncbi:hybrid sensor histidine kinase/response regulator [Ketobacter nezhaii]|uniref:hybrid sensor histidine kinase/response regulator n=1 Tax=Ketobacter sp. MCCC 1A13808 TaxID=2602738 RepID=UPI000F2C376C|nr:hybrid sensor histidine kinase/response regulator [Ketobacter sp. MCCC 1A13808]RLP54089.1 MAG: hybrid sensor histidine kinase/response regulator [Ketobacter sp.]